MTLARVLAFQLCNRANGRVATSDFAAREVRLDPGASRDADDGAQDAERVREVQYLSAGDLRDAARRLDSVTGTISGTIAANGAVKTQAVDPLVLVRQ